MATGIMTIAYGSEAIRKKASAAARDYRDAQDRLVDVRNKVNQVHSSRRYLDSASAFLKKKSEQYDQRKETLQKFGNEVIQFMDAAEAADGRVAKHLEQSLKDFKKITGIKGGFFSMLGAFFKKAGSVIMRAFFYTMVPLLGVVKIVEVIKELYNKIPENIRFQIKMWGKAVLKLAGAIFAIAAVATAIGTLIAATGAFAIVCAVLGVVGAAIIAADAITDYIKAGNVIATYYKYGIECAKQLDEMSTANFVGILLEDKLGVDAETIAAWYTGIQVAGVICNLIGGLPKVIEGITKNGGLWDFVKKEFKTGFWDKDKYIYSEINKGVMAWFWENGWYKEFFFELPIDEILDHYKQIYSWIKLVPEILGFDSFGEFAQEGIKEILDKVPVVDKIVDGWEKISSYFDNYLQPSGFMAS